MSDFDNYRDCLAYNQCTTSVTHCIQLVKDIRYNSLETHESKKWPSITQTNLVVSRYPRVRQSGWRERGTYIQPNT